MDAALCFEEFFLFKKERESGKSDITSDARLINHAVYMNMMIKRINPLNKYLHDHWERWAKSARYFGQEDLMNMHRPEGLSLRQSSIGRYSYAIPNEDSLNTIARLGPILEVGSGSGYWAFLLRSKCVDIVAIDDRSSPSQWKIDWFPMTQVIDAHKYLQKHAGCSDRSLFLCWPLYGDEILSLFKGRYLIIIGEPSGSCWTLSDDSGWELTQTIEIPTWPGCHDRMYVYKRKDHK